MRTSFFNGAALALLLCATLCLWLPDTADGQVPQLINYQGRLTNPDGSPVEDNDYLIAFAIYDDPSDGALLWNCPPQVVPVESGLFTYQLGTVTSLPDSLFESDTLRWLGIEVSGEPVLPRTRLASVAYAFHSLHADTAAYALSGSGGWVDMGSVVALATSEDFVGVGTTNPVGRLDVTGSAYVRRGDGLQDQIILGASDPNVGLELRSGTTGGTPFIDFVNDDSTDFDARMILLQDTILLLDGNPYVNCKIAGRLLVERTQATGTIATEDLDGIRSYYTYRGSAADPYTYQGSAIHATSIIGGNSTDPVGTVHGISSQCAMLESGDPYNEMTPLFLSCNSLAPCRLWGVDLNVHGPMATQANLIQGLVNFVNNYNAAPVQNKGLGLAVVTGAGRGGAASPEQQTSQTYPLDIGLAIVGSSGTPDQLTKTQGYKTALQIGGNASGWMGTSETSHIGTGILIRDVETAGMKFKDFLTLWTPALSIDVPYVMEIRESDTPKWLLSQEGSGAGATVLFRDLTEADEWWWGAFAGGDKRLSLQNDRVVVMRDGTVGIGTTTPANILTVEQGSSTDPIADGWTTYSSKRWKTNIEPVEGALEKVQRLRGVSFDWKSDGRHDIGLIAEEVGEVIPEVVAYEANGTHARSVDYGRLVALLIEATKEQQKTIQQLKVQLRELQEVVRSM